MEIRVVMQSKDDTRDKVKVYLEMILDRLDKHSDTWNSYMEKTAEYTVKLLELEFYSQNLMTILDSQSQTHLQMIWKGLNLIVDPVWDISEEIFSIFGELDSLYSELIILSTEQKIDFDSQIKKLNELKDRPTYIRTSRGSESIQAGRSLIASLKEHCFRIMARKSLGELKTEITAVITEILILTQKHLRLSKTWISGAVTSIEIMRFKTEDALEDLLIDS